MTERRYLSAGDLIAGGYLQEVNRAFFHPLGLALEVMGDDHQPGMAGKIETKREGLLVMRVWDERDDWQGVRFAQPLPDQAKADAVAREHFARRAAREEALGYWVQPVPTELDRETSRAGFGGFDGCPRVTCPTPGLCSERGACPATGDPARIGDQGSPT